MFRSNWSQWQCLDTQKMASGGRQSPPGDGQWLVLLARNKDKKITEIKFGDLKLLKEMLEKEIKSRKTVDKDQDTSVQKLERDLKTKAKISGNDEKEDKPLASVVEDSVKDESGASACYRCGTSRCKTCNEISDGSTSVTSTKNKKTFPIVGGVSTCDTANVVYLISCQQCPAQYVGETSGKLRKRMNEHRCGDVLLVDKHFRGRKDHTKKVTVIEKLPNDLKEEESREQRNEARREWKEKLGTILHKTENPHGLNER